MITVGFMAIIYLKKENVPFKEGLRKYKNKLELNSEKGNRKYIFVKVFSDTIQKGQFSTAYINSPEKYTKKLMVFKIFKIVFLHINPNLITS